jgi:hypothetical protein
MLGRVEELRDNRLKVENKLESNDNLIVNKMSTFKPLLTGKNRNNDRLYYLAESLAQIALEVDMVYFMKDWDADLENKIISDCCRYYDIMTMHETKEYNYG